MKFDDILRWFGDLPWFDFEMVLLVSGEADACVHTELYRWRRGGKIVELRRGLFVFAEPWRKGALERTNLAAALAGSIYAPSYITGRWVLEHEGLLGSGAAESGGAASTFTCATARPARVFENEFGIYRYDTLPTDLLFGTRVLGARFPAGCRVALPEKALLDLCFFEGGDWDGERLAGLGLSRDADFAGRLGEMARRTGRPRLIKAAKAYGRMVGL